VIDFRYHLVSIVAIFLALSVGIVLGTTLLKEPAIDAAETFANQLREGNTELRDQVQVLQKRAAANDAVILADTPKLVRDTLIGKSVVIVEAPGTTATMREAVQQAVLASGAIVTGRVILADRYVDISQSTFVDKLAAAAKPAEMTFPVEGTAYDRMAAVLAGAIMTSDPEQVDKENPVGAGILDTFQRGGLLTVTDKPVERADLAVLTAPAEPYVGETSVEQATAAEQAGAIVSMALALDEAGQGTVMAGTQNATLAGGAIAALREDNSFAEKVSTVDTADMPLGRVVVVYALREQLSGLAGQYGIGPGSSGVEPSATPAPTATTATSGG
jgi:hypothetical protein